jgi:muramidase (phage lysozyme)
MGGIGNLEAFLAVIREAEGTARQQNPYAVTFGYRYTLTDFRDHPVVLGTWMGERLPDALCRRAGLQSGCKSTAAGAYQALVGTWREEQRRWRLPDFTPGSQDLFARGRIRYRGALDAVLAGRFSAALRACRKEWASLPGAGYGQLERDAPALLVLYKDAGGQFA